MEAILEEIGIFLNISIALSGVVASYAVLKNNFNNLEKNFQNHIDHSAACSKDLETAINKQNEKFVTKSELDLILESQHIINDNVHDKLLEIDKKLKKGFNR